MRRFNWILSFCFAILVCATFALAGPLSEASSPNPVNRLVKRSACSNGIKANCGSASVGCSGSQCTVCCGTCCQCFTLAPRDNSCGSSTPIVTPDCSGKCGLGGASSSPPTGSGSSSSSRTIKNSLLCRLFKVGC
ncbi:hypothetical protein D6C92_02486 [Aureobasidium pullulans]|nr:hypothetical protein D6C92_02486 [Aureobasidium pullulans]